MAKGKIAKDDYKAILEAIPVAEESLSIGKEALQKADTEQSFFTERYSETKKG